MELGPNMLSLGPWIGCWTLSRLGAVQNQPLDAKYLYKILRPEYCVRAWCLFQKFSAVPASGFAQRSRSEKWKILCFRIASLSPLHRRSCEQSLRLACFLFRQKPKKVNRADEALRLVAFLCAPIFITATNFPFRSSRPSLTTFKQEWNPYHSSWISEWVSYYDSSFWWSPQSYKTASAPHSSSLLFQAPLPCSNAFHRLCKNMLEGWRLNTAYYFRSLISIWDSIWALSNIFIFTERLAGVKHKVHIIGFKLCIFQIVL